MITLEQDNLQDLINENDKVVSRSADANNIDIVKENGTDIVASSKKGSTSKTTTKK